MDKNFRPDIEGLRGIAILTVVAYHAGLPGFGGGYVGVDVFFVLSGYLITGLLFKEMEKKGRISLPAFYARRARRLLPASALTLLITIAATYMVYSPVEQSGLPQTSLATATYVSNLYFARTATDYLRAGAETNPLLHTWSLAVEEQFYFAWPLLVMLALKTGGRRRLLIVMVALASLSFALSIWLTLVRQPWAFFSSPTRAWEFAIGGLGVLLGGLHSQRAGRIIGWLGLAMILLASVVLSKSTAYPGWAALLPVLGTVAVLRSGTSTPTGKLLGTPVLQFFGKLSYSWYLWHWPVLVLAAGVWGELSLPARLGLVAFALVLAMVSYKLVENPVRFHPFLLRRPAYALIMALVLTLFGIGAALSFRYLSGRAAATGEQARFIKARQDIPVIYQDQCITLAFDTDVKDCVYGRKDSNKTIVLFGDSYAAHWFPAVNAIAEAEGWRLVPLFKAACAPVDTPYIYPRIGRRYTECEQWRESALKRIEEMRPALVMVAHGALYVGEQPLVSPPAWLEGAGKTLNALNRSGARIAYLRGTPAPSLDVVGCLARGAWQSPWRRPKPCTFERAPGMNDDVAQEERRIVSSSHATYIDMTEYICPGDICEPERDGTIIYQEGGHLTGQFVNSLTPVLRRLLTEVAR
jgi:peptidoglycan/LPS O-acetylase OafA/YrhL